MNLQNTFTLNLEKDKVHLYSKILSEEDFEFGNKNINVEVSCEGEILKIEVFASTIHELKIGVSSVIKSLEVVEKTISVQ